MVVALCDYYAQAPIAPEPTEVELLSRVDAALDEAEKFLIAEVKKRDSEDADLDPPNSLIALSAYLSLRAHRSQDGRGLAVADDSFIEICLRRSRETDAWLVNKPGAVWACAKAYSIAYKYRRSDADLSASAALDKSDMGSCARNLQNHIIRLFSGGFADERKLYNASVTIDLCFTVKDWASAIAQEDIDTALKNAMIDVRTSTEIAVKAGSLNLRDLYTGGATEKEYQVVAPAALLTGIDKVLHSRTLTAAESTFWQPLFYALADELDRSGDMLLEATYTTAHHLRALTESQLVPREVSLVARLYRDQSKLASENQQLVQGINESLGDLVARYGNPNERVFFVSSNAVFIPFTLILYLLFTAAQLLSPWGSITSIICAIGQIAILTPLSLILWARKEKFHEKTPAERRLSLFQFWVVGGWIAIPIAITFVANFFKNFAAGTLH